MNNNAPVYAISIYPRQSSFIGVGKKVWYVGVAGAVGDKTGNGSGISLIGLIYADSSISRLGTNRSDDTAELIGSVGKSDNAKYIYPDEMYHVSYIGESW